MTAREVLEKTFGYQSFRGQQEEIINQVVSGHHAMALMPTGAGKSICFQIPAKILGGTTIVLSPLIALMKDQVDQAKKLGFKTDYINSSLTREEREKRYQRLVRGEYELLYVTPERFLKFEFRQSVSKVHVPLLAVDEAHCVSEWGHDFRPDFTRISEFREFLKNPTMLFLTATATPQVQKDIVKQAGFNDTDVKIFAGGLSRPNLAFSVESVYGLDAKIQHFVSLRHRITGPCIVYFSLIGTLEKFASAIHRLGFHASVYHGSMSAASRRSNQQKFLSGESDLMLATPAFGLGINKPDVRLIIHGEVPGSIEAYFQEAGRAGRDNRPSQCVLLYDEEDLTIQEDFIKWAHPEGEFIRNVYQLIADNRLRVRQEGLDFIRERMNFYNRRDFRVETSVNLLKRWGFISEVSENDFEILTELQGDLLDSSKNELRIRQDRNRLLEMVRYAIRGLCRVQLIHQYFGDSEHPPCGICDICTTARG